MTDDKKKILIVEDDKSIAQVLAYNLLSAGYAIDMAFDGEEGLKKALGDSFDLILLDIMLPKMDGFELCRCVREKLAVPIIMCTAREEEKDKILGLDTGADDYITKPFSLAELLSRIRANLRRSEGELVTDKAKNGPSKITLGPLSIDTEKYTVELKGNTVELSKKEYDFLCFLAMNPGVPYSREELLDKVWGYSDYYGDVRTVDVTVKRLRDKLESDPAKPEHLLTKRNIGYYLV